MSMFPSPLGRSYRSSDTAATAATSATAADTAVPGVLRWGCVLAMVAVVLMLVAGFIFITAEDTAPGVLPPQVRDTFAMNQQIVGWVNILAGLTLAGLTPQLLRARYRRWWAGCVMAAVVANALGLFVRVAGPVSVLIVVLLACAAMFVFSTAGNRFTRARGSIIAEYVD